VASATRRPVRAFAVADAVEILQTGRSSGCRGRSGAERITDAQLDELADVWSR